MHDYFLSDERVPLPEQSLILPSTPDPPLAGSPGPVGPHEPGPGSPPSSPGHGGPTRFWLDLTTPIRAVSGGGDTSKEAKQSPSTHGTGSSNARTV